MDRRVVVTGLGMVTPIGVGVEAFWAAAREGRSGTGRPSLVTLPDGVDELPIRVVGEVKDFDPSAQMTKKLVVRSDRNTHFAFAACAEALADAGIDMATEDKARVGIVLASNYGGLKYYLDNLVRLHQKGPSFVSAYMAIAYIPSAPVGQLSIFHSIAGYTKTIINDAAGGTDAIGAAFRTIKRGDADLVIAGGFEAAIAEASFAAMNMYADICKDASDPAAAHRPFNTERNGMVVAEGGGIVILEDYERARARGAHIYAEIVGFGQTSDAVDIHHFAADGVQYARAMKQALDRAGLSPDDVDYVNADGRGDMDADRAEAAAFGRLFGERIDNVPVSAPRSMMGNPLAGAGPIDLAFIALAMRDSVLPPTINLTEQDPACRLNLVKTLGQAANVDVALLCSRGATGVNAALALRKVQ
ncbi:MAG TPA: beta-ketoacyl-[acyl-carrier-protein] synthase family protein [Thermomicrobiales bacterium]|jgi:3-oxoacyl-[acyl-carrier-protein] synthase II